MKKISKHVWCLPKGMWETPHTYERRYSGQMRLNLNFLAIKENAMSGSNPTPHITPRTPSPQWSMVVATSCCMDVFHRQGLGNWLELKEWWMALNTGKFLRETCFSLPEIWDWDGGSPSSRTMTLSILLKQHASGVLQKAWGRLPKHMKEGTLVRWD